MSGIVIQGGHRLAGDLHIHGSKNATLPIMAASLLNAGYTIIKNCPYITDVEYMAQMLAGLGCKVYRYKEYLMIDSQAAFCTELRPELAGELRASSLFMGAMLGRFGEAKIPLPGGCRIGSRPVDIHLAALKLFGADYEITDGQIVMKAAKLTGANIHLRMPSVGATENVLLAAAAAEGVTVLDNAACEPEITALCKVLCLMGAEITGAGTSYITITGMKQCQDVVYEAEPDRIVAGTYMCAVLAAGGRIHMRNVRDFSIARGYLDVLSGIGLQCEQGEQGIVVCCEPGRLHAVHRIKTGAFPEFPTDMQSLVMSVLCKADGISSIEETVFEKRLKLSEELRKMGAEIAVQGNCAQITGKEMLYGAQVQATDLRASAALIVAALSAEGITRIDSDCYLRRGYENMIENLQMLGADIQTEVL